MQGIDADRPCDGSDDRSEDNGGCVVIHEHAADKKQHVDKQQEAPLRHLAQRLDEQAHDALVCDAPCHCGARAGKDENEAGGRGSFNDHVGDILELYGAVYEECDDGAVDNGNAGCFGDREYTAEYTAEDDDRQEEGRQSLKGSLSFFLPGGLAVGRISALFRGAVCDDALHESYKYSRGNGRHKQAGYRGVADCRAVKDHQHARRHDRAEQRSRGHDRSRVRRRIAFLLHHGDEENAEGRSRCDRQTDDRAHQQRCTDGDDSDGALEVAEPHVNEFDERFKQAAAQHKLAGKYEKRYCEE